MSRSNLAYAKDDCVTPEEYLAFEREAREKHEFINGEIRATAGASEKHNVISSNLFLEIGIRLKNTKCRAFASDMRVKAKKHNYFYPDIVITCGERQFDDEKKDVLVNPRVVIEILSKSTKLKDRNEKLDSYMALKSVTDYVFIEQDAMRIEHFSRLDGENWKVRMLSEKTHELAFETIDCRVSITDIYNEIEFETAAKKRKKS